MMLAAMTAFTCNDAAIKLLSARYPIGELLFIRGSLVTGIFFVALFFMHRPLNPLHWLQRWNLARALSEVGVTFTFLSAIALMPLAVATTLLFVAPIIVTVIAAFGLQETVSRQRWLAVLLGFAGVVIVSQPWELRVEWILILPLAAALLAAIRDTAVRFVPAGLSSLEVSLTTAICVTVAGLATAGAHWHLPQGQDWPLLLLAAGLICTAYFCYVVATRVGELSFIAPLKYVSIPVAILLDMSIWGIWPAWSMIAGAVIITASGLLTFREERRRQQRAK